MPEEATQETAAEAPEGAAGGGEQEYPEPGPNGFPTSLKPAEMRPEHAVSYWKHRARSMEERTKGDGARLRELEQKASQLDALTEASKTESEKQIEALQKRLEAAEAAAQDQRRSFGARLVETKLGAAAASKGMSGDQLKTLAGDLTRFLADDGVNDDALDEWIGALPDVKAAAAAPLSPAALGGGRREPAKASGVAAGRALYAERHQKTTPA